MNENEIGTLVLDATFEVHKLLGPGLLESSYEHCLAFELLNKGLTVSLQKPAINDIHLAQVLTYLKLSNCRLGYLLNFNVVQFKTGIKRLVNNL
jgi:hypothetical protein